MRCIIHPAEKKTDEKLTSFTQKSWGSVLACSKRWKDLVGLEKDVCVRESEWLEKSHEDIVNDCGYHRSCYSRFTNKSMPVGAETRKRKLALLEESSAGEDSSLEVEDSMTTTSAPLIRKRSRMGNEQSTPSRSVHVLPIQCIICGSAASKRVSKNGKRYREFLTLTETVGTGKLKEAAQLKAIVSGHDDDVLRQIRDKDCVAIEVRYHRSCYYEYTKDVYKSLYSRFDTSIILTSIVLHVILSDLSKPSLSILTELLSSVRFSVDIVKLSASGNPFYYKF